MILINQLRLTSAHPASLSLIVSRSLTAWRRHTYIWRNTHISDRIRQWQRSASSGIPSKDLANQAKHGISFSEAQHAFDDPRRVIAEDLAHSTDLEKRYFCFGKLGDGVLTVRFTYRHDVIRIFGAGYWTRGLRLYEKAHKVHK